MTAITAQTNKPMTEFSRKVIALIAKIPRGKVATYGQIAALAGKPHGARGVAWLLNSSARAHRLPWQRVLGAKGRISFPRGSAHFTKQRSLLLREGVEVGPDGGVELATHQWSRKPRTNKTRKILGF